VNDVLRRFHALGVAMEPSTVFGGAAGGEALTQQIHSKEHRWRRFDAIVACAPGRSETALADLAEAAGIPFTLAGDAVAPRTAMHAFREGDDAGRAL
jgi:hypothetical protein